MSFQPLAFNAYTWREGIKSLHELSATCFLRSTSGGMALNRFLHSTRPGVAKIMGHSEAQSSAEQRREVQSSSAW